MFQIHSIEFIMDHYLAAVVMTTAQHFFDHQFPIVIARLQTELAEVYTYHNTQHTLDVIEQSIELGRLSHLDDSTLWLLSIAALYHDSGFLEGPHNHESRGCKFFLNDAAQSGLTDEEKAIVTGCIMATRMPQHPLTSLEALLCDADLDYLGRSDFEEKSQALFREKQALEGITASDWEWIQQEFLHTHRYHTEQQRLRRPVIGRSSGL